MVMLLWNKLIARFAHHQLDLALANGAEPGESAALALRARRLTDEARRRELARTIRRLVRGANARGGPSLLQVGPLHGRVTAASEELDWLASRLTAPTQVSPRGVAQALLLITDGTGPLYNRASHTSLSETAAVAAQNLVVADSRRCAPSPSSA
jgi:hypothetical protein